MQLKKICEGKWYETTHGVGLCTGAGGTFPPSVKINITRPYPRGVVVLTPRQVLRAVEAPK